MLLPLKWVLYDRDVNIYQVIASWPLQPHGQNIVVVYLGDLILWLICRPMGVVDIKMTHLLIKVVDSANCSRCSLMWQCCARDGWDLWSTLLSMGKHSTITCWSYMKGWDLGSPLRLIYPPSRFHKKGRPRCNFERLPCLVYLLVVPAGGTYFG